MNRRRLLLLLLLLVVVVVVVVVSLRLLGVQVVLRVGRRRPQN